MVKNGFMWDGVEYGSQDFANAFGSITANGVVGVDDDFKIISTSADSVRIGPGKAWINGRQLVFDGYKDVVLPHSDTVAVNPVMDSVIVIELSTENESQGFEFKVKTKYPGDGDYAENEIPIIAFCCDRPPDSPLDEKYVKRYIPKIAMPKNIVVGNESGLHTKSVRFPDGTMICYGFRMIWDENDFDRIISQGMSPDGEGVTIGVVEERYPVEFVEDPGVVPFAVGALGIRYKAPRQYFSVGIDLEKAKETQVSFIAIGRWKN